MEKIKGAFSSSSASASAKLSKAFRFNGDRNVLGRTNVNGMGGGNPFRDGPTFEERSLPKAHLIFHIVAIFFTFLAICTMGAVAAFQAKWFAVSGGTGFVLFLLLVAFLLSAFLMIVPIVYDRWDRLKRPAQFLHQTRTTFILHAFGTVLILMSAFIVTIGAWTAKGCKNADNDPHAELGDGYKDGLSDWCTTKKASAIFDWLAFGAWATLLVLTSLVFRRERKESRRMEPSFIPPDSTGVSYAGVGAEVEDPYADKSEVTRSLGHAREESTFETPTGGYGYTRPGVHGGAMARPSVDVYGAFDGDMPGAGGATDEPSRTMQLAYDDPYAQIRASLMDNSAPTGYPARHQAPQQAYGNGGLPNPPAYAGYQ
ncbi:hypothetical protein IAU60_006197 [Kwoniella sp. DSM 27419]